jgi:FKBP-type peptidyl-prolyl cis-trans isomerase SlyD
MKNRIVKEGVFVEIEYVLSEINERGEQGDVLEECVEESAFGFYVGSGEVLEALEKELMGKSPAEPFEVVIPCKDAYGTTTDDAIVMIPKTVFEIDGEFDNEHVQEGEAIVMNDDDGNEMVGVVVSISNTEVEMDFNHPFAELNLHFVGSICDVREEA